MASESKPDDEPQGNHIAEKVEDQPSDDKPADDKPAEDVAAKEEEEKKENEDGGKVSMDFSGSWVLKSSSDSIDAYYKSEGWGFMMRKAMPMIPIKQIITQVLSCSLLVH